jgi:ParB family chromosome partitioning protein
MPKRFSRVRDERTSRDSSEEDYSSVIAKELIPTSALMPLEIDLLLDIEIDKIPKGNFMSSTVVQINADHIVSSAWADRSDSSYADNDFDDLRASIRKGGTNTVPIKVRPIPSVGVSTDTGLPRPVYEIVYGHRRHRACMLAEVPVTAIVVQICDRDLIMEMFNENSLRKDLSPIEQGMLFHRMYFTDKLFESQGQMADALCRDRGDVSRCMKLALLPIEVTNAIDCPKDLTIHSADKLGTLLKKDPEKLIEIARESLEKSGPISARDFVDVVTAKSPTSTRKSAFNHPMQISISGFPVAEVKINSKGEITATLKTDQSFEKTIDLREKLVKFLQELLADVVVPAS